MTFVYDDPNNSHTEAVRFLIQDVDDTRQLLQDEEIEYLLAEASDDVLAASLACAEALLAKGAHRVTKKIGDRSINYSDLTGQYERLITVLQSKTQRGDFSFTVPSTGFVADTVYYPRQFETTDLVGPRLLRVVRSGGVTSVAVSSGGDMESSVYDVYADGVVDKAEGIPVLDEIPSDLTNYSDGDMFKVGTRTYVVDKPA